MTTGPSAHLSWEELGCHDGTPYPAEWRASRAVILADEFEKVRVVVGGPIRIGSAYRTVKYNASIGGAKNSQHCQGRALDLYPPSGWTVAQLYDAIRSVAMSDDSRIYGLGRYPTFVHMDVRPMPASGKIVVWRGSRAWAEQKDTNGEEA